MGKNSRKKRRQGAGKNKAAPKRGGSARADSTPSLPLGTSSFSSEGGKERPGDDDDDDDDDDVNSTSGASVAPVVTRMPCEGEEGGSTGVSSLNFGEDAEGVTADVAAAAAAAVAAVVAVGVGEDGPRAGDEGEDTQRSAVSSPSCGNVSVATAGSENLASCNDSAPMENTAPLPPAQEGDAAREGDECTTTDEKESAAFASQPPAVEEEKEEIATATATVSSGAKDGAGEVRGQAAAAVFSTQRNGGGGTSVGMEGEEKLASVVDIGPTTATAVPAVVEEAHSAQGVVEESREPQAKPGAVLIPTEEPRSEINPGISVAVQEVPLESGAPSPPGGSEAGAAATITVPSNPPMDEGFEGQTAAELAGLPEDVENDAPAKEVAAGRPVTERPAAAPALAARASPASAAAAPAATVAATVPALSLGERPASAAPAAPTATVAATAPALSPGKRHAATAPPATAATAPTLPPAVSPVGPATSPLASSGAAERDSVNRIAEPLPPLPPSPPPPPPPPPSPPAGSGAVAGDDTTATPPVDLALKANVAGVSGGVDSQQSTKVVEVSYEESATRSAAVAAAVAVAEGVAAPTTATPPRPLSSSGAGPGREKAEAAAAAAAAAAAVAATAVAEAASAARAAAAAAAKAEAALGAVAKMEAGDTSVRVAAQKKVEVATVPTVESAAAAAAEAAKNPILAGAAATPESCEGKAEEDSSEERAVTIASDTAVTASPSLAAEAFPPLFPRSTKHTGLESHAAATTGATFLSGSVGADVFTSLSGGGAQPWPGLSDDDSGAHVDDGFGGSSSERRISVEEAAAFMNTGSTISGGAGGRFATGTCSAMTGTSSDKSTAVPKESPAAAGDAASFVGRPLFAGLDDFLSCPSVGMGGLGARRVNSDAVLLPSLASSTGGGGAVAEGAHDLGSRRSTAGELVGPGVNDSNTSRSSRSAAVAVAEVKTAAVAAVVGGGAPSGVKADGGGNGDGGGVVTTTKSSTDDNPAHVVEEVAGPALLVRKYGSAKTGKAAVVETVAAVEAGQHGGDAGGVVVKNSGLGGGVGDAFATADSAVTSDAGEAGAARPPPSGAGAGGAVPPLGTTNSSSGGCCVVS